MFDRNSNKLFSISNVTLRQCLVNTVYTRFFCFFCGTKSKSLPRRNPSNYKAFRLRVFGLSRENIRAARASHAYPLRKAGLSGFPGKTSAPHTLRAHSLSASENFSDFPRKIFAPRFFKIKQLLSILYVYGDICSK